jgi:hypothetical protein
MAIWVSGRRRLNRMKAVCVNSMQMLTSTTETESGVTVNRSVASRVARSAAVVICQFVVVATIHDEHGNLFSRDCG